MTISLTGCSAPCYYHPLLKEYRWERAFTYTPPHISRQRQAKKQWLPSHCVYSRLTTVATAGSVKPTAPSTADDLTKKRSSSQEVMRTANEEALTIWG